MAAMTAGRLWLLFLLSVGLSDCPIPICQVIQLFGALCAQRHHPVAGSVPLPLSALDVGGVKDHLESLLRGADLTLRDRKGLDSLNFLAHNIVVNAQCYTDWSDVSARMSSGEDERETESGRGRQK